MADFTIKGKDGKTRHFVGLKAPPTPEELDAIEQSEAPKDRPVPTSEWIADHVTDAVAHPFESVIPKDAQMKAASVIAGSPQQENPNANAGLFGIRGMSNEIGNMFGNGGTLSAFWHQPLASARGFGAGAAEGGMDLLSPVNALLATLGEEAPKPTFGSGQYGPITRAAGRGVQFAIKRGVQAAVDGAGAVLPEGATTGIVPDLVGMIKPKWGSALKAVGKAAETNAASKVPAELREVWEALRSQSGDQAANRWLERQVGKSSSTSTNAAGASKSAGGSGGAPKVAEAPPAKPATASTPSPEAPASNPPPEAKSGGQPVMAKTEPTPAPRPSRAPVNPDDEIVNNATGETAGQFRTRMQERIDKANKTSKAAKNPTQPPPKPSGNGTGRIPEAPADMEDMVDRMNGGKDAPLKGNGTSTTTLEEDITALRRKYGADRVARKVRPDAPEVANGAITRNDMDTGQPAQSWMPDIAQEALLRDLKAGSTKDPSKTLRALSQALREYKRNGGAANSPVARELQTLLKAHGFLSE